jgi:hypothetical protein
VVQVSWQRRCQCVQEDSLVGVLHARIAQVVLKRRGVSAEVDMSGTIDIRTAAASGCLMDMPDRTFSSGIRFVCKSIMLIVLETALTKATTAHRIHTLRSKPPAKR